MLRFVVGVESQFYPQIGDALPAADRDLGRRATSELGLDQAEDEELESVTAADQGPRLD